MKLFPPVSACLVLSGLVVGGSLRAPRQDSGLTPQQAEILSHLSLDHVDDGHGSKKKTLLVRGVDVRIVDGDLIRGDGPTTRERDALVRPSILGRQQRAACLDCQERRLAASKATRSP